MQELLPVAVWYRVILYSVTFGPDIIGKMLRAANSIQNRKVHRVIDIDCFLLNPVMPMVIAWRDDQLLQEAKSESDIRMYEHRH